MQRNREKLFRAALKDLADLLLHCDHRLLGVAQQEDSCARLLKDLYATFSLPDLGGELYLDSYKHIHIDGPMGK